MKQPDKPAPAKWEQDFNRLFVHHGGCGECNPVSGSCVHGDADEILDFLRDLVTIQPILAGYIKFDHLNEAQLGELIARYSEKQRKAGLAIPDVEADEATR